MAELQRSRENGFTYNTPIRKSITYIPSIKEKEEDKEIQYQKKEPIRVLVTRDSSTHDECYQFYTIDGHEPYLATIIGHQRNVPTKYSTFELLIYEFDEHDKRKITKWSWVEHKG